MHSGLSLLLVLWRVNGPMVRPLLRENVFDGEPSALYLRLTGLSAIGVLDRLEEGAESGPGKAPVGGLRGQGPANLLVAGPICARHVKTSQVGDDPVGQL